MFSAVFWRDLTERVISSAAAGALGVLGAGAVDALTVDWSAVLGVSLGAALASVLKGLAARGVGDPDTAAFLR